MKNKSRASLLTSFALGSPSKSSAPAPAPRPAVAESAPSADSDNPLLRGLAVGEITREQAAASGKLREIPLKLIDPDPDQPRRTVDDAQTIELANTIRAQGVLQPPAVRPHPSKPGRYMIIFGERRWRALRLLEREVVEVILRDDVDEKAVRVMQLIENSPEARVDVRPWEEALAMRNAVNLLGSATELVKQTGHKHSHISKRLKLLELPAEVAELLSANRLTDYETALGLATLKEFSQTSYERFVEEAKTTHLRRQRVLAEIRRLKDLQRSGDQTRKAFAEEVNKLRGSFENQVTGMVGSDVKVTGLEIGEKKRDQNTLKLTVEFPGYQAAENFLKAMKK